MIHRMLLSTALVLVVALGIHAGELETMNFQGEVKNFTVNETDTVKLKIKQGPNGPLVTGEFGCNQLFGRFALAGLEVEKDGPATTRQFSFQGQLHLGNDGSGFAEGTSKPFTMTLLLSGNQIEGVYHIDHGSNYVPQMGTVRMTHTRDSQSP